MVATLHLVGAEDRQTHVVGFEDFWALYPRRVARKDALRAWERVAPALHVTVIEALFDWRRVWMQRGEMQFVPHAATWLNGERWDDELPQGYARPRPAEEVMRSAQQQEVARREMSPQVREALDKLRRSLRAPPSG